MYSREHIQGGIPVVYSREAYTSGWCTRVYIRRHIPQGGVPGCIREAYIPGWGIPRVCRVYLRVVYTRVYRVYFRVVYTRVYTQGVKEAP